MLLSDFSIRRPVAMIVIIIAVMGLGLMALYKLRVNQIPDVDMPVLVVTLPYPGASPATVEREIVDRIEKSLQSIPQVYEIRSTSSESQAQIVIQFQFSKNMVEASDEVRNAIAAVRHKLPLEMREPVLQRIDPAAQPIMNLALSSETARWTSRASGWSAASNRPASSKTSSSGASATSRYASANWPKSPTTSPN